MSKKFTPSAFSGLTNQERAALAFGFVSRADEVSLSKVYAATPKKTYTEPSKEFQDRFDGYFMAGVFFATQYWQNKAGYLAALGSLAIGKERDWQAFADAHGELRAWESRLFGLELAMETFCQNEGLLPEDFWRLAEGKQIDPIHGEVTTDRDYADRMRGLFETLIGKGGIEPPCLGGRQMD
jgi:hypothetical protein